MLKLLKRNIIDFIKCSRLRKYYTKNKYAKNHNIQDRVIVMFDGKIIHGGISDRLWGMVSMYRYCKENNCDFKILFHKPFNLSKYLEPNKINWEIDEKELVYDLSISEPKCISMLPYSPEEMNKVVAERLKKCKPQKHIYTNTRTVSKKGFHDLYHELFKMSENLKENVDAQLQKIKVPYVSCTFRFQQLLGDFKEGDFLTLEEKAQKDLLINKCKEMVKRLHDLKKVPILVTSDSLTFLKATREMENVITVEGEIIHPDFDNGKKSDDSYLKSFIDLYMIANANEIYVCNIPPLYCSGFPGTAACVYSKPYYEIRNFEVTDIVHLFN